MVKVLNQDFSANVRNLLFNNALILYFVYSQEFFMKRTFFCTIPALILTVLVFASSDAYAQSDIDIKSYLHRVHYYRYSKIRVFEADSASTLRFREVLTPALPKTPDLLEAERNCPTTDEIRRRTEQELPIFNPTISKNKDDCEAVRDYYTANAAVIRIGRVFVITTKEEKGAEALIIGAVSVPKGTQEQEADPNWLIYALDSPITAGILDADDLRAISTKEKNGKDKGSLAKPLGATMFEHCKARLKQNQFKDVTQRLYPQFSPEITYLIQKGVFVVNPRGLLPPSPATKTMSPEAAALATIDEATLPYLARWQILDPRIIVFVRGFFHAQEQFATDSIVIVTGKLKKNGKYELYEVRCGNELATKKSISYAMPLFLIDMISEHVDDNGKDKYLYDVLNPSFYQLPLPLNIKELLTENKASPAQSKPTTKSKK
jgi:hypothetical protein